jgi:hypothetical protein
VEVIAVNTDEKRLAKMVGAGKKLLLGVKVTKGKGAAYPEVGEYVAEESKDTIRGVLEDAGIVLVMGNIGGGTGAGVIPVVADIARENGSLVICIVSRPFSFESGERTKNAEKCLAKLRGNGHTVLVLENDYMLEKFPDLPVEDVFLVLDRVAVKIIKSIASSVSRTFMTSLLTELESLLRESEEKKADADAPPSKSFEIPVLVNGDTENDFSSASVGISDDTDGEAEKTPEPPGEPTSATVTLKVDLPEPDDDLQNESFTRETSPIQKTFTDPDMELPQRKPFDDEDNDKDEGDAPGAAL